MSGADYQPLPLARRQMKMKRQPLLSSCAVAAAMVAAGHAGPVRAQAFLGTPTTVSGTVGYNRSTPGIETITVSTPTAVVDWAPSDTAIGGGAINYLPSGNVATFSSTTNFTILNRILPTDNSRAVTFNGSVLGQIGASAPTTGGNIWFYSPGGIILGSTAQFDVGSLILTTNAIQLGVGNTLPTGTIQLRGATDSRSSVTINAGATINALNSGSYVALVAPRISQGGTVNVDGSAAYVAAESADITINGGLFDIAVQTGSAVNTGGETTLTHSGTTTGPGATSGADPQAIYMVAMPKNDAVTMLVGGSIGYASSASVENGVVVLSAGLNLTSASNGLGGVDVTRSAGPAPSVNADFTIANAAFGSRLAGYAALNAAIVQGAGTTSFASSASLTAGNAATISVTNAGSLLAEGDVLLDASKTGSNGVNGGSATGGTASITLVNATMETNRSIVGSGLRVLAGGTGGVGLTGGNGTGGSATVSLDDSVLTVGVSSPQTLLIDASGTGGNGTDGGAGGIGRGGTASLTIFDSAPATTTGALSANSISISAQGTGGGIEFGYGSTSGGAGGAGIGGNASLTLSAGTLTSPGITLDVSGSGGTGNSAADGPNAGDGGSATGGVATFTVNGGTLTGSSLSASASATGGNGGNAFESGYGTSGRGGAGGTATGGTAAFVQNGGDVSGSFFQFDANGSG